MLYNRSKLFWRVTVTSNCFESMLFNFVQSKLNKLGNNRRLCGYVVLQSEKYVKCESRYLNDTTLKKYVKNLKQIFRHKNTIFESYFWHGFYLVLKTTSYIYYILYVSFNYPCKFIRKTYLCKCKYIFTVLLYTN